jgi:uncharacterized membrane protein
MIIAHGAGRPMLNPLHGILLAFPLALFTAALASDLAYLNSAQMQWSNFSAWLITGALVFGGLVLVWALVGAILPRRTTRGRALLYFVLIAVMWVCGLVNAFQHSRDAWSSVGPVGATLSIISTVTALAAAWIGYSANRPREVAK